jgi:hypothetical protein
MLFESKFTNKHAISGLLSDSLLFKSDLLFLTYLRLPLTINYRLSGASTNRTQLYQTNLLNKKKTNCYFRTFSDKILEYRYNYSCLSLIKVTELRSKF